MLNQLGSTIRLVEGTGLGSHPLSPIGRISYRTRVLEIKLEKTLKGNSAPVCLRVAKGSWNKQLAQEALQV